MKFGIVTSRIGRNDGQGRVNREIAIEALRQGHEVVLFSEDVDQDMADATGVRPVIATPPAWLPSRLLRDQAFALRTRSEIGRRGNGCDALLANGFATWAASDVNAVHFVHDSWMRSAWHPWRQARSARSLYAWTYSRLNARLEKAAFGRSRHVVAISGKVRQELLDIGVPGEHITVITNGVDTAEFGPGPRERARFSLPENARIGLFAGDLRSPRKNLDTVLRAQAAVPELHLAVAGRAEGTGYPEMARALGIADRVHFLGFQTDMLGLMRASDLLLFPSRYEPCGLVLLEALATGLPVITARSAGGADIVTPEVGAVLDDPNDHALLARHVRDLLGDDARRATMATAARRLAQQHSWRDMAAQYVDMLCEAADRRRLHRA